jgi:hypothetical protein
VRKQIISEAPPLSEQTAGDLNQIAITQIIYNLAIEKGWSASTMTVRIHEAYVGD